MNNVSIFFEVDGQDLRIAQVHKLVEKTVNYVEAYFTLSNEWTEFDLIEAIWSGGGHDIVTVLDRSFNVHVPHEVLAHPGLVKVNLVGADLSSHGDELEKRLTTKQIICIQVKSKALIDGDNTEIEPTLFEKFVAEIHDDADRAEESANRAEAAEEAIAGYMEFRIDETGHLQYYWKNNITVDFFIRNGHLYVEEDY